MLRQAIVFALVYAGLLLWATPAGCQEIGVVQVDDLRLRSGPGTAYRILSRLDKGATVTIIGREQGWLKIEHQRRTGFIFDSPEFVRVTHPPGNGDTRQSNRVKTDDDGADTLGRQLQASKTELLAITQREGKVLEAFNDAEMALNRVRQQVRSTRAELDALKAEIHAIQAESADLENEIRRQEAYAARRLVALYKLNWLGRVHVLATADSFFDFIVRKVSLERILGQDERLLDALRDNKTELESLLTRLNTSRTQKRSMELSLKQRGSQLARRQNERKTLLAAIRSEKALEQAALKSLQAAASELDARLQRIRPSTQAPAADPSGGARQEPFDAYKGLLRWPVRGKIISFFGPYRDKKYAVTNFQSGINIQAERGEPIRAVSHGHTIFASWFKGFGNMMILDHGNHYYTVYAHLEEVFKTKGDRVEKGEVIATVGDSGSLTGPALHFEVRHHGKPVDPLEWIRKG